LTYVPTKKEIQQKVENLIEKLEVNSQNEKGSLINDSINRVKTIFEESNIDTEFFYNIIFLLIQLSHSPLMTTIDLDMLRERFESRYIKTETNKIMRNTKVDHKAYYADIKFVLLYL